MKTIAIFSGYHLPHLGGIERYTDNLTKKLVKDGYKVIIISSNFEFKNELIREDKDISYCLLPVRKLFVSRYPIPIKNKGFKEVMKYLDNFKIDAIIVNTRFHLTSLVGAKYGYKNNIPTFLIEHGSQHLTVDNKILDYFGAHYEHALTIYLKKYINYYYGVSAEACKWQKHFKIDSDGIWYNSINDFSNKYKINKPKDKTIFLYAGRILKQKGILELVQNFFELTKKYNNIELRIAGDGNLLPELKEKYNHKKIKYLNKLDFSSLCKEYANANVFVYAPNWPEGLPTGILEAGLMECAVISSPQGGNKEIIINNKTGIMTNNKDELLMAMEKYIIDEVFRKKMASNLKKKVLDEFTWDITSKVIEKTIEEKIEKR